jgi:transcriptional regulator GlxA family with amidase domain
LVAIHDAITNAHYSKALNSLPQSLMDRASLVIRDGGKRVDQRVIKVLELMRADLRGQLSLAGLAHSVNLSVWRLSHIFRSEVGMPPIQYLKVLRIEKAKHLLETSFLSVKEITHQVGLKDESHFVRDFKKTYGVSPTPYRVQFNGGQPNGSEKGDDSQPNGRKLIAEVSGGVLLPIVTIFSSLLAYIESVV